MIEKLTASLIARCERRDRVFKITGTGGPDDVYLIRYYVIKSRWFNFFIHQFLRSDRDDLHDHPWHFATFLVSGAYTEYKWDDTHGCAMSTRREANVVTHRNGKTHFSTMNRLVFRRATDQHKVVVPVDLKYSDRKHAATTLFFSGPTIREWGFVREIVYQNDGVTPISERYRPIRTWIPWREYLGLPSDTPGRG